MRIGKVGRCGVDGRGGRSIMDEGKVGVPPPQIFVLFASDFFMIRFLSLINIHASREVLPHYKVHKRIPFHILGTVSSLHFHCTCLVYNPQHVKLDI